MSTTRACDVRCPNCQTPTPVLLVESANADRHPAFRDDVIDGRFMRFCCPAGHRFVIERELLWTDVSNGWFIAVFPTRNRTRAAELEAWMGRTWERVRDSLPPAFARHYDASVRRRVVFGYDELREKVLCARHGLDELALAGTRLALEQAHPEWRVPGYEGMILRDVTAHTLLFESARRSERRMTTAPIGLYRHFAERLAERSR